MIDQSWAKMPQDTSDLMPFWLRVSTLHSSADQLQIQIEIKWSQDWTQHVLINMTSALMNANWQNIKEENRTVRLKELMVDLPIPTHQSDDKWTYIYIYAWVFNSIYLSMLYLITSMCNTPVKSHNLAAQLYTTKPLMGPCLCQCLTWQFPGSSKKPWI